MAAILVYVELDRDRSVMLDEEKHHVANSNQLATIDLKNVISDLYVLKDSMTFLQVLDAPNAVNRDLLEQSFKQFALIKGVYDQIRFLDKTGMEIVRINYNNGLPEIIPQSELQNKGQRYYFTDTIKLGSGQIFVSPMDLNVEKGQVEHPLKPMIRFGTPVVDKYGNKRGVLLVNYLAKNLLVDLETLHEKEYGDWMLLNQDGYWLKSSQPDKEWGFMFKEKKDVSFAKEYPDTWKQIDAQQNGQFFNKRGLFTFETITPVRENIKSSAGALGAYAPSSKELTGNEYYWKIISHVPIEKLEHQTWRRLWRWLIFLSLLTFCLGIVSYWLAWSRVQRDQTSVALKYSEEKHRRLIDGLPDDHFVFSREMDGTVSYISKAAEKILGKNQGEMIGRNWHGILDLFPDEMELAVASDAICSENKVPPPLELKYNRPDGSAGVLEIYKHPVCDADGEVAYIEGIVREITERKRIEMELEQLATIDPLTGIFNRWRFLEQVSLEQGRSRRYGHDLTFMMLDLDHFKKVNDTYGHQAGDEVLKTFAACCKGQLRSTDFMGRVGGEEFAILLVETSGDEGVQIADRLREKIMSHPAEYEGQSIAFTVSIGLTTFEKDDLFVKDLFQKADKALYQAKEGGRNRVVRT